MDKGGFSSSQSMGSMGSIGRMDSGFGNDMGISSGNNFGSGSGFGLSSDVDSFSSKSKGKPSAAVGAPSKGMGMKLGKNQRANQFLESLKAEGEVIVEDVRPSGNPGRSAAPPPTDPITLTTEEKLNVTLKIDGGVSNFDVLGTLSLQILNPDDRFIQVQIASGDNPEIKFKTHPNINKELFSNENILGTKDHRGFPAGQSGDGLGLLKWRMQSKDESDVPLTINCWPSFSGNETYVSIEYKASSTFDQGPVVQWERFLPLRTLKVLLVENDDSTRHVVSALLRNCSYEVTAVSNSVEAWKVLIDLNKQIDIVLTEVLMPYLSGIGLLSKIMSHVTRKNIPVIMMSSDDSMGIVFNCLSKGKNELKSLWQHVWRKCHSVS